jgi:hypothetical protein
MAILSPRDEATQIVTHYFRQLTLATGRRWTPDNDRDMRRLNLLMRQIADEDQGDTIPPYTRPQQPPAALQGGERTTVVLERDPANEDARYQEWRRERQVEDDARVQRMLRNGNGH